MRSLGLGIGLCNRPSALVDGAAPEPDEFVADGVTFDGAEDMLLRGGALTGAIASPTGIVSFWFRGGVQSLDVPAILHNDFDYVVVNGLSEGAPELIQVFVTNDDYSADFRSDFTCPDATDGEWHHFALSWKVDEANGQKVATCAYDGASIVGSFTDNGGSFSVAVDGGSEWAVGAQADGDPKLNGDLAEVYFSTGTYLDFTDAENRAKFLTDGKPADLGEDGSGPTGNSPLIYLSIREGDAAADFAINRGAGGNFAITGELALASTSPSD